MVPDATAQSDSYRIAYTCTSPYFGCRYLGTERVQRTGAAPDSGKPQAAAGPPPSQVGIGVVGLEHDAFCSHVVRLDCRRITGGNCVYVCVGGKTREVLLGTVTSQSPSLYGGGVEQ